MAPLRPCGEIRAEAAWALHMALAADTFLRSAAAIWHACLYVMAAGVLAAAGLPACFGCGFFHGCVLYFENDLVPRWLNYEEKV